MRTARIVLLITLIAAVLAAEPLLAAKRSRKQRETKTFELQDGSKVTGYVVDSTELFWIVDVGDDQMRTVFRSDLKAGAPEKALTEADVEALWKHFAENGDESSVRKIMETAVNREPELTAAAKAARSSL